MSRVENADVLGTLGAANGVFAIAEERVRQIEKEGFDPRHDDGYSHDELVRAAVCYASVGRSDADDLGGIVEKDELLRGLWPWDADWFKPSDMRNNLVKAGALIAAEIDRMDRAAAEAGVMGVPAVTGG